MANKRKTSEIVAVNVIFLRTIADLTLQGFISAIGISMTYLRKIEKGEANITSKLADKIANLFEINTDCIYSEKTIKLKAIDQIAPLKRFYEENKNNAKYFISRKSEDSVAYFLKSILIPTGYFAKGYEVSEIQYYIKKTYNKDFSSKDLSRELNRLVKKNILFKKDVFGNQSIYSFSDKVNT
jgi:transcriptional regulator with XRE-family HTH domain